MSPTAGATRPTGLVHTPARKRYQEGPETSTTTCTLWPSAAAATVSPDATGAEKSGSFASSHVTATSAAGSDPPSTAVSRVHSTADDASGSPAHTPSVNGSSGRSPVGPVVDASAVTHRSPLAATTVAAPAASSVRRETCAMSQVSRAPRGHSPVGAGTMLNESSTVSTDAVSPGWVKICTT